MKAGTWFQLAAAVARSSPGVYAGVCSHCVSNKASVLQSPPTINGPRDGNAQQLEVLPGALKFRLRASYLTLDWSQPAQIEFGLRRLTGSGILSQVLLRQKPSPTKCFVDQRSCDLSVTCPPLLPLQAWGDTGQVNICLRPKNVQQPTEDTAGCKATLASANELMVIAVTLFFLR